MNFECKELKITDDSGFGCTIEFRDKIEDYFENMTFEEQLNPSGKYLLIQRSYPEEEYDIDWYTIETSETEIEFNQKDKMYVKLSPANFEIYCSGETVVIGLNLSAIEYSNLEKILKTQFKDMVVMMKD